MSARLPGSSMVRVKGGAPALATVKQTVPTGLSGVPPSGPAIPVMAIAVSALETPQRTRGHRLGNRFRHRAVLGDQGRIHAQHFGFGLVGVDHRAAHHVGRRPGPVGQPCRDHARGARLRGRDPAAGEQLGDLVVDVGAVGGEHLAGDAARAAVSTSRA